MVCEDERLGNLPNEGVCANLNTTGLFDLSRFGSHLSLPRVKQHFQDRRRSDTTRTKKGSNPTRALSIAYGDAALANRESLPGWQLAYKCSSRAPDNSEGIAAYQGFPSGITDQLGSKENTNGCVGSVMNSRQKPADRCGRREDEGEQSAQEVPAQRVARPSR